VNITPESIAAAVAVVAVLAPMMWYMLRENRAAMNGVARELSDLTMVIALDVATRPSANEATRRMATDMVKQRDTIRGKRLDDDREAEV
jgi:hypothetical protein